MSAQTTERETHLLDIGQTCSHSSCSQVDFLPFKCQHCKESFCQEHYKVEGHKCPKYDEFKHNRVAPDCPFCQVPVSIAPGQDPNVRMEQHFERECSVITGRVKAKTTPTCARANCKKIIFLNISCDNCKQKFCPEHRFPSDHSCKAPEPYVRKSPASARPRPVASGSSTSKELQELNAKASAAASEALDSVQKGLAAAKASTAASASKLPFNKTDRRAKAERESRIKAMEMREKKGLLSAEEKKTLAQLKQEVKQKDDCIVM